MFLQGFITARVTRKGIAEASAARYEMGKKGRIMQSLKRDVCGVPLYRVCPHSGSHLVPQPSWEAGVVFLFSR